MQSKELFFKRSTKVVVDNPLPSNFSNLFIYHELEVNERNEEGCSYIIPEWTWISSFSHCDDVFNFYLGHYDCRYVALYFNTKPFGERILCKHWGNKEPDGSRFWMVHDLRDCQPMFYLTFNRSVEKDVAELAATKLASEHNFPDEFGLQELDYEKFYEAVDSCKCDIFDCVDSDYKEDI